MLITTKPNGFMAVGLLVVLVFFMMTRVLNRVIALFFLSYDLGYEFLQVN
jgi:hypothetical protein